MYVKMTLEPSSSISVVYLIVLKRFVIAAREQQQLLGIQPARNSCFTKGDFYDFNCGVAFANRMARYDDVIQEVPPMGEQCVDEH